MHSSTAKIDLDLYIDDEKAKSKQVLAIKMLDLVMLKRARIDTADHYRDAFRSPHLHVEGGYAAHPAEYVLCRVSAEGVGRQELVRAVVQLELVDWDDEVSGASHGTIGAVAGAGNYACWRFGLPADPLAVAASLVDDSLHGCPVRRKN